MSKRRMLVRTLPMAVLLAIFASPLVAQGNSKKGYEITPDRAATVVREVLVKDGFNVVRIEQEEDAQVVYYRRGNMGKGKGKGPLRKMVIRRVSNRVVFEETPSDIMVNIELKLRL
ncbi:MAG: hypothetical protein HKM89_14990 [Gemmatimonadales bacterium]|nr:hypothetical protein [Gemmatimonadales bacterium]